MAAKGVEPQLSSNSVQNAAEGQSIYGLQNDPTVKGVNVFDPRVVAKIHQNDDTDVARDSHHHTLGPNPNQGSPGNHNHDGTTSTQLMAGVTLTGSRGGNAALLSVISAMVTAFGCIDSTT